MRLKSARLVNLCQHDDLSAEFSPGLNFIHGPNGFGKSNLMAMIRLSITNSFSSRSGVKQDEIRRGTPKGAPAYVTSVWQVAEGELVINRFLQGGKSSIYLNNLEIARGKEDEVTAAALTYLKVTAPIVDDFMFASQERLQEIITGTKSTRASLFQTLCGLQVIERAEKLLRDSVNLDKGAASTFDEQAHADMRIAIKSIVKRLRELRDNLNQLKSTLPTPKEVEKARKDVQSASTFSFLVAEINKAKDRVRKNKQEENIADTEISLVKAEIDQINELINANETTRIKLESTAKQFNSEDIVKEYKQKQEIVSKPAPEQPSEMFDPEELISVRNAIATQQSELQRYNTLIKEISSGAWTDCPTCGTSVTSLTDKIKDFKLKVVALQNLLTANLNKKQRLTDLELQWKVFDKAYEQWSTSIKNAQEFINSTAGILQNAKEFDEETRKNILTSLENVRNTLKADKQKLAQTNNRLTDLITRLGELRGRIKTDVVQIDTLQRQLAATSPVTDQQAEVAKELIAKWDEKAPELAAQERMVITMEAGLTEKFKAYQHSQNARIKTKTLRKLVLVQEEAKAILHRDRLPARVVTTMLQFTTEKINSYLREFNMPFTVEADPTEFSFTAIHNDGSVESAARLSAGQRVVLAIAFWLARSAVFVGQLPFFCLDEPTAHLDEQRVLHCADIFQRLSAELVLNNRQGIVITHHRSLAAVAGSLVDLGGQ